MAENPDVAALHRVEPRHQREQRALASPVEAEQHREGRWSDRERHVVERLASAITVADALDCGGRRCDGVHLMHYALRRL
jgi:hypothetical protein